MMKIRPRTTASVALSVAAIALASACGGVEGAGSSGSGTSLQLANANPPSDSTAKTIDWWSEEVEAAASGDVSFEQLYSGSLLAGPDVRSGVGDGRAAGGQLVPAYHPAEMPLSNITSVPVLYESDVIAMAFEKLIAENEQVAAEFSDAGLEPLFIGPAGTFMIANTERVTSVKDLQGKQIRMIPPLADAYEQLGVEPSFISSEEMYESLERGVIDGALTGLNVLYSVGVHEVAPNFVFDGLGNATVWVFVMNSDTFEGLDESVQDAMRETSSQATEQAHDYLTESEAAACKDIIAQGGNFVELSQEDQAAVQEAGTGLVNFWYTSAEEAGYERAELEAVWEEYNQYLEEFESASTAESGIDECL